MLSAVVLNRVGGWGGGGRFSGCEYGQGSKLRKKPKNLTARNSILLILCVVGGGASSRPKYYGARVDC